MAIELERLVRSGDPRIRQVDSANYSDYVAEAAIVSTTGIRRVVRAVRRLRLGRGDRQRRRRRPDGLGALGGSRPRATSTWTRRRTTRFARATRMLGAVKPTSIKCTAVFDPRTAATLLVDRRGRPERRGGRARPLVLRRTASARWSPSACFTLLDDPTDARHFAASAYDGEGLACRRNVLIEPAYCRASSTTPSRRGERAPSSTGSAVRGGIAGSPSAGCRALQLVARATLDQAEIFRRVGDGVFVESIDRRALGGQSRSRVTSRWG